MKIVISATGESLDSQVDSRFGRCRYFLLVEAEGHEIKSVQATENPSAFQGHGAGIGAAQQVGNLQAEKLITGNLGPNASRVLSQLGIKSYQATGKAEDAVHALIDNKLQEITQTVPGHFGTGGFGRGSGGGRGMGGRRGGR